MAPPEKHLAHFVVEVVGLEIEKLFVQVLLVARDIGEAGQRFHQAKPDGIGQTRVAQDEDRGAGWDQDPRQRAGRHSVLSYEHALGKIEAQQKVGSGRTAAKNRGGARSGWRLWLRPVRQSTPRPRNA